MKYEDRKNKILNLLNEKNFVSFTKLEEEISSSPATIRRDLSKLEKEGKLLRFHGGIKQVDSVVEASMNYKKKISKKEKEELAKYVSNLIKQNEVIFLGAGSTTYNVIKYLKPSNNTFVTNGIAHAEALNNRELKVFTVCGFLKDHTKSLVGEKTNEMIELFNYDKVIISANGISENFELLSADEFEHNIKKSAIKKAKEVIVVADNKKFNMSALYSLKLDEKITTIITDSKAKVESQKFKIIKT